MLWIRDWSQSERLQLGEAGAPGLCVCDFCTTVVEMQPQCPIADVLSSSHPLTKPCPLNGATCTLVWGCDVSVMCVPSGGLCRDYLVVWLAGVSSLPLVQSSSGTCRLVWQFDFTASCVPYGGSCHDCLIALQLSQVSLWSSLARTGILKRIKDTGLKTDYNNMQIRYEI